MDQKIKYRKRPAPLGAATHTYCPSAEDDDLTDRLCQYCGNRLAIVGEVDLYEVTCGHCTSKWRDVFDPSV